MSVLCAAGVRNRSEGSDVHSSLSSVLKLFHTMLIGFLYFRKEDSSHDTYMVLMDLQKLKLIKFIFHNTDA